MYDDLSKCFQVMDTVDVFCLAVVHMPQANDQIDYMPMLHEPLKSICLSPSLLHACGVARGMLPIGMQFVALPALRLLHQCGQPFLKELCATAKPNTHKPFIGCSIDIPRQEKKTLLFCQVPTQRFC